MREVTLLAARRASAHYAFDLVTDRSPRRRSRPSERTREYRVTAVEGPWNSHAAISQDAANQARSISRISLVSGLKGESGCFGCAPFLSRARKTPRFGAKCESLTRINSHKRSSNSVVFLRASSF